MLLFIWFHVDYSKVLVCLWKESPRDRLGANKCYYSRKGSRKEVHLLFWNMEISLMTWLTWQVDSGDRWLTSSWRPPMERERKEGLSLCKNTLPCTPLITEEFSRSEWAIKWHHAISGRQAPVTRVMTVILPSRWPGISLCPASRMLQHSRKEVIYSRSLTSPVLAFPAPGGPWRWYTWSEMTSNVRANLNSFGQCLKERNAWMWIGLGLPLLHLRNLRVGEVKSLTKDPWAIRNSNPGGLIYGKAFSW